MNTLLLEMYYKWSDAQLKEHELCQKAYRPIEQKLNILGTDKDTDIRIEIQDHINEYSEAIEKIAFIEGTKRGIAFIKELKEIGITV